MRTNDDIAEDLKYQIADVREAVQNTHRTLCEFSEVIKDVQQQTARGRSRLETLSANSSLIAICAVISTIALCKLAWWS